jgi:hypothetical protein
VGSRLLVFYRTSCFGILFVGIWLDSLDGSSMPLATLANINTEIPPYPEWDSNPRSPLSIGNGNCDRLQEVYDK